MSGEGRFPPEVLSRVADGIEAINQNLIDLRELQRLSWEELAMMIIAFTVRPWNERLSR